MGGGKLRLTVCMDVPMVALAAQCTVVKKKNAHANRDGQIEEGKKKNTCKCRKNINLTKTNTQY